MDAAERDPFASSEEGEGEEDGEPGEPRGSRKKCPEGVFFGAFRVDGYIGRGRGGGTVFAASHAGGQPGRAAAKWPVPASEVDTLQLLNAAPACLGVPRLLGRGKVEDEWYMVMEGLGRPLSKIFRAVRRFPLKHRWGVVSTLGRMLVLRLEGLHKKGYVHNDVKPDNILLGRLGGKGMERYLPYLVDLGTAQPFSGSDKLRRDLGTVDFNSVRSGRDLQRRPHDDLEALAWTMLHGLFGKLPWMHLTKQANWSDMAQRFDAVSQVQAMKERFLKEGPGAMGPEWGHMEKTPQGLRQFLQLCQPTKYMDQMPPYSDLAKCLGAVRYGQPDADVHDVQQLLHAAREGRLRKLGVDYADGEAEAWREEEERAGARRQAAAREAQIAADLERMRDTIVWRVVGGEERGGIMVRKGQDLASHALSSRLATGALVEQENLEGERLSYNKLLGDGPNCGWVSIRIKYGELVKPLLEPHELTYEELQLIKEREFSLNSA